MTENVLICQAVKAHISAKSGNKTYDQIRNHYYNTLNKIASHAPPELNEAGVPGFPDEAFVVSFGDGR